MDLVMDLGDVPRFGDRQTVPKLGNAREVKK